MVDNDQRWRERQWEKIKLNWAEYIVKAIVLIIILIALGVIGIKVDVEKLKEFIQILKNGGVV